MKAYLRTHAPRRFFRILRILWLYAEGIVHFGPTDTHRAATTIRQALDAFEAHYGRLPDEQEKWRLAEKLAWFNEHYQRVPTWQETIQIIQQLHIT